MGDRNDWPVAFPVIPQYIRRAVRPDPTIATACCTCGCRVSRQIGQLFELILKGTRRRGDPRFWPQIASRRSRSALRIPLAAWLFTISGLFGMAGSDCAAILRGVAMIVFWRAGRWRRATV